VDLSFTGLFSTGLGAAEFGCKPWGSTFHSGACPKVRFGYEEGLLMPTLYQRVMTAGAVLVGLAGIIAIHVMDLQGKLEESPYLGVGYVFVCLVAGPGGHFLVVLPCISA
jgi:hypothetical protein